MERIGFSPPNPFTSPLLLSSVVGEDFKSWTPLHELYLPVEHHRIGHYNQMRTPVPAFNSEVGQEGFQEKRNPSKQRERIVRGGRVSIRVFLEEVPIVWMVFPSPISSARIPLRPFSNMVTSQFSPTI